MLGNKRFFIRTEFWTYKYFLKRKRCALTLGRIKDAPNIKAKCSSILSLIKGKAVEKADGYKYLSVVLDSNLIPHPHPIKNIYKKRIILEEK